MSTASELLAAMSPTEIAELQAQLKAQFKEINAAKKSEDDTRRAEYGVLGADFFTHMVENSVRDASDSSDWIGFSEYGIPHTVDGVEYTFSIRATDVKAKAKRVDGVDFVSKKKQAEIDAAADTPTS